MHLKVRPYEFLNYLLKRADLGEGVPLFLTWMVCFLVEAIVMARKNKMEWLVDNMNRHHI